MIGNSSGSGHRGGQGPGEAPNISLYPHILAKKRQIEGFFEASPYSDGLRYGLAAKFAKYEFAQDASKNFLWS